MKFFLQFLLLFLFSTPVFADTVFLTPTEAFKTIFSSSKEIISEKKTLSTEQKDILKKKLGYAVTKETVTIYIAKTDSAVDGYAIIDNEIGKTDPITYLVAINPKGQVRDVEILVYRETHGYEVQQESFMKQFFGMDQSNMIQIGNDIKHVSGATLSSRAMAKGVKRALTLWNLFYGK